MAANPTTEFIETLLLRNLFEVFDELDPTRRRGAIEELYAADATVFDPHGHHAGHAGVERMAADLRQMIPETFRFSVRGGPQVLRGSGRLLWSLGPPGEPDKVIGTDFVVVREGRIASLHVFLDRAPQG